MNLKTAKHPAEIPDEIAALIKTLHDTERRLAELTGGEVDTVVDESGKPFLLRHAQEQLRHHEAAKRSAILNALPANIALLDAQGIIVSVNEAWLQFAGDNAHPGSTGSVGMDYAALCDRVPGEAAAEAAQVAAGIRAVLNDSTRLFSLEYACHSPTEKRWFQMSVTPLTDRQPHGAVVMHLNITERKLAEITLEDSNEKFHQLADHITDAFWVRSPDLNEVQYLSPAFEKIWGRTTASLYANPHSWLDLIVPEDRKRVREKFAELKEASPSIDVEYRIVRPDGERRWVRTRGFQIRNASNQLIRHAGIVSDITDQKRLGEQVRQTQKLEAVGTLAGGIAHDFNNILAAINGYTELSLIALSGNPKVRGYLGAVMTASARATNLVRQILAFSRQQALERRRIFLGPIVSECISLLRATIPTTIEFDTSLAPDAPTVLADATQIHQILMNLGTNAWHAMKDGHGRLEMKLERYGVDAAHASRQPGLHPGIYARLSVGDTGCGMDQATLLRIFEPFFTTKPVGEGTGLGLAVVHGIMDNHDGAITVHSTPGQGTVFHLYFPEIAPETTPVVMAETETPRGQGERILVVDDEELLVQLNRMALTELGYQVETTTKPELALAWVRADPMRFALVMTDQTMPGMTGLVLATHLQSIRAGLPVILTSGYVAALTPQKIEAAGISELLTKPTSLHTLGTALRKALFPKKET